MRRRSARSRRVEKLERGGNGARGNAATVVIILDANGKAIGPTVSTAGKRVIELPDNGRGRVRR